MFPKSLKHFAHKVSVELFVLSVESGKQPSAQKLQLLIWITVDFDPKTN